MFGSWSTPSLPMATVDAICLTRIATETMVLTPPGTSISDTTSGPLCSWRNSHKRARDLPEVTMLTQGRLELEPRASKFQPKFFPLKKILIRTPERSLTALLFKNYISNKNVFWVNTYSQNTKNNVGDILNNKLSFSEYRLSSHTTTCPNRGKDEEIKGEKGSELSEESEWNGKEWNWIMWSSQPSHVPRSSNTL